MLKKSNGYFLAELLLTLAAWLIIAGVIFPLIMKTMKQSIQAEQENVAVKLLYEGLITAKKEGVLSVHDTLTINQTEYEMKQESMNGKAVMEVCIRYVDVFQKEKKLCEILE